MYEEDRFIPKYNDTDDNDSPFDNKTGMLKDIKSLDKGYHKIKNNNVGFDQKNNKNKYIEFYTSGEVGKRIRNAITGIRYNEKVGSAEEDLFFKTKIASNSLASNAGSLFYDSPEQFEKHMFVTLDSDIKEKWYSKNIEARRASKANHL